MALPHARVENLSTIVAGLGVNRDGIYSESGPRLMLAFVSPQGAAADHLRFLSEAAKACRDETLLNLIIAAPSREELLAILKNSN